METATQKRHPFSFTLGAGPYKYVGSFDMAAALANQASYGSTEQAFKYAPRLKAGLGTCAHCGHAILDMRIVQTGNGDLYGVGSDCIMKTACEGDVTGISALERQIRADNRRKRDDRETAKRAELESDYQAALAKLASLPHPNAYFAGQGKTLRDYYEYCSKNSKTMKGAIARANNQ